MDDRGGLRGGGTPAHGPRADFLHASSEVGLQAEQAVGRVDHAVQARLAQAEVGQEGVAVFVVELGQLFFNRGRHRHHLRAFGGGMGAHGVQVRVVLETIFQHVGDVHHRLQGRPNGRTCRRTAPPAAWPAPACARPLPCRRPWRRARRGSAPSRRCPGRPGPAR
ncbi:hypothetical protein G6F65_021293 [Rhizopus arrhizus]|nr:hypothetical protein G6F65_021293 [Rhizopus arrhizus]